jgi:hypothetical protein
MSLSKCPDCRKLCFTESASCPSCARAFQPAELRTQAEAEERAFQRKGHVLFLVLLLAQLMVLLFVAFRG